MSPPGTGCPPSPLFDVSEHLFPIRRQTVFGDSKPLTLDVGCGNGEFLLELSRLIPDFNHIGVEIKTGRFKKAVKKTEKLGARNLKFIHMDAFVAAGLFAPDSFDRVYINFPDPWPKDRHRKHRIINRDFVSLLGSVVRPGGFVEIASDHAEYIDFSAEIFGGFREFQSAEIIPYPEGRPETRFERIFKERGVEIKYLIYRAAPKAGGTY